MFAAKFMAQEQLKVGISRIFKENRRSSNGQKNMEK